MEYLPNAAQMKEADRYTIEELGIPSLELMEKAARGVVNEIYQRQLNLENVCVVCGSGNNGGDGLAIARMLSDAEHQVTVAFVGNREHCTKETATQMDLLEKRGVTTSNTFVSGEYSVIVDAIFGVGLSREITGSYREVIEAINESSGIKVSVDIPSGISADTGCVMGVAVKADITVTVQNKKLGLMLYPGYSFAGEVQKIDIGIDTSEMEKDTTLAYTYEPEELMKHMPKRTPDSHKGTYGKALIIAGSKGMAGAAYLSALAAYRTGAGLVQIYTADANRVVLQTLLPEAIITTYDFFDEGELLRLLRWADVVSIGSGIGTSDKSRRILRTTLQNVECPCVVDADALNLIADHIKYLEQLPHEQFVFTPHMKEMSRITKKDISEIKENRMAILQDFIATYPVTCVLKDARTVVACEEKSPYVNLSGNEAMAKGGSGDVLAGVITGLIAQGKGCDEAASLGVFLHGLAGDKAKEEKGSYSVLARELADAIAVVLCEEE